MHLFGEVNQPCTPPIAWLEDAQLVAYKQASGEFKMEKGLLQQSLLSREAFSAATSSPDFPIDTKVEQEKTIIRLNLKKALGETNVKVQKRGGGSRLAFPGGVHYAGGTHHTTGSKGDGRAIPVGKGKMYVKGATYKHNLSNTITASTDKPIARKPGLE
jgi:hypothetical protein